MTEIRTVHRRQMLRTAAVIGAMTAFPQVEFALAQAALPRTPGQILGPFFPLGKTPDMCRASQVERRDKSST